MFRFRYQYRTKPLDSPNLAHYITDKTHRLSYPCSKRAKFSDFNRNRADFWLGATCDRHILSDKHSYAIGKSNGVPLNAFVLMVLFSPNAHSVGKKQG